MKSRTLAEKTVKGRVCSTSFRAHSLRGSWECTFSQTLPRQTCVYSRHNSCNGSSQIQVSLPSPGRESHIWTTCTLQRGGMTGKTDIGISVVFSSAKCHLALVSGLQKPSLSVHLLICCLPTNPFGSCPSNS